LIVNTCLAFANSSVNTLASTYAAFLGAGALLIGALTGMFYAVAFAMRPISGPATTKLDQKKLVIFANILGVIVNAGYAFSGSITMFVAFRVLNGVQFSIIGALAMTVASNSLPPDKMGSGLGIYGVGGAMAMAIGPSIGIALRELGIRLVGEQFGFMLVYLFATACMLLSLIPSMMLKLPQRSKKEIAMTGAWYKNIIAANAVPPTIILMLVTIGYALYNTYLFPFAEDSGIAGIGAFYTVYAIALVLVRPISGKMVDRYGSFKPILFGAFLFAGSFVIVGFSSTLFPLLIAAAIGAVGYSSAMPAIQAMCMQSVPPVKRSVASNTSFFGMDMGFFLGPVLGGFVYSMTDNYSVMFLSMVVPIVLSMIVLTATWKGYEANRISSGETVSQSA
jgi:MFS family permease